jgi:hypothetical protein
VDPAEGQRLLKPRPGNYEELSKDEAHVYQRYLIGMLAPKASEVLGEQLDELATEEDEETEDGAAENVIHVTMTRA